ncbi:Leucine-rich receptor-like protein kinase family protein [Rhynchospora pubera]|uniref:Leucine-rich receptor-like protein kinase family protein n=1 Tax=Rhynchospora pubera TaxID=906938 RepID=A0AAV8BZ15_9POAL|nr:Leucine-rich receptor-like protein kinase family protein [Rhynchospora pubera]
MLDSPSGSEFKALVFDYMPSGNFIDFSLARFLQNINEKGYEDQSSSVAIMGSIGYVPPEYGVGNHISLQGRAYSTEVCREPTVKRIPGRSDRHESLLSKKTRNLGERFEAGLQLILGVGLSCAKVRPSERMDIKDVVIQLVEVRQFLFH